MSVQLKRPDANQSEAALRLTQFAVDVAAEAMFTVAPDGRILHANKTACERLEYTREELLQMCIGDIDPHYSSESWPQHFDELRRSGKMSFETQHRTKHGRLLDVDVSVAYFKFDGAEYCCSSVRDITKQKQAENLQQLQHDVLAQVACGEELTGTLNSLCEMVETLVPQSLATVMLLSEDDGCLRFAAGPQLTDEIRAAFEPLSPGVESGSCGAAAFLKRVVIVEEHRTAALRDSESRFRRMVDGLPEIVWSRDADGVRTFANKQWAEYTGLSVEQAVADGWVGSIHPEDVKQVQEAFWKAFHARCPFAAEFRLRRSDGQYRWFLGRGGPWFTDEGEFAGFVGGCIDISRRKEVAEQLERQRQELAHLQRLNTVGELGSGLAHELNQPLGALTNYANGCLRRLKSGTLDPARLEDALGEMVAEAERASQIIERLRSLVRRRPRRVSSTDVNQLMQNVVNFLATEARQLGVKLELKLSGSLHRVPCDVIQIEQVIVNLVRNAFDAVSDLPEPKRVVTLVSENDGGDAVAVAVIDRGMGHTIEDLEELFDPFYSTKEEGLGVGLSISRKIIKVHSGQLAAVRDADAGLTFRFTLPTAATETEHE